MTTYDPINHISVLSTDTVQIRPKHVGTARQNSYLWRANSRQWTAPRPINACVIEHRHRRFPELAVLAAHDPEAADRLAATLTEIAALEPVAARVSRSR
jgi:hypothetical protein